MVNLCIKFWFWSFFIASNLQNSFPRLYSQVIINFRTISHINKCNYLSFDDSTTKDSLLISPFMSASCISSFFPGTVPFYVDKQESSWASKLYFNWNISNVTTIKCRLWIASTCNKSFNHYLNDEMRFDISIKGTSSGISHRNVESYRIILVVSRTAVVCW